MLRVLICVVAFVGFALSSAKAQSLPDEIARPYTAYTQALEEGSVQAAVIHARDAWQAAENLNFDRQTTAILADNFAKVALRTQDFEEASQAFRRAAELLGEIEAEDYPRALSWTLAAHASLSAGEYEDARGYADIAGDMVENSEQLSDDARAQLMFNSRAIQAVSLWSDARLSSAHIRAVEAMEAMGDRDATGSQYYGILSFVLGATHALRYEGEDAAFWLTVAYHYMPSQREAAFWWSNYARGQLDEDERIELLDRLANTSLPELAEEVSELEEALDEERAFLGQDNFVDAVPSRRASPTYPYDAAAGGFEGVAVIEFTVDANGRVRDPEILVSLPVTDFGDAGIRVVRDWRYEPATLDGVAIDRPGLRVEFVYSLAD